MKTHRDSTWSRINIFVFENDDIEPTWSKEIVINRELEQNIAYPERGKYGDNLLAMGNLTEIANDSNYSVAAMFPLDIDLLIRLKMNVLEGNVTWSVDGSKQEIWFGNLNNGEEIRGQVKGGTADLPIKFTGTGKIEVQAETFEAALIDKYIGTKRIELSIK